MDTVQTLKLAAVYTVLWIVAGVIGVAIAGVGVALGGLGPFGLDGLLVVPIRLAYYPRGGAVVIVLGLLVWKLGSTAVFLTTVTTALERGTTVGFDPEPVKSDILSVLDDRLSEMHQELSRTRQQLDRQGRDEPATEFEFPDE